MISLLSFNSDKLKLYKNQKKVFQRFHWCITCQHKCPSIVVRATENQVHDNLIKHFYQWNVVTLSTKHRPLDLYFISFHLILFLWKSDCGKLRIQYIRPVIFTFYKLNFFSIGWPQKCMTFPSPRWQLRFAAKGIGASPRLFLMRPFVS